jgi:RHS repeat-associated protein
MQRLRSFLVLLCVFALVLGVPASNAVAPASAARSAAPSAAGPSLWHRLLDRLGVGSERATVRPLAVAAVAAAPVGPPKKATGAAAKTRGPVKRVKELVRERTANGRFFSLSDGRVQAELSAAPLNYRDAKGRWQPVDTGVRATGGRGVAFQNRTNAFQSSFGRRSDALVRFGLGQQQVTLGLEGRTRAVAPRAVGDTVSYADVIGGADLSYEVLSDGVKERIVLDRPVADPTFTFTLRMDGVRAQAQPDGSIAFLAKGKGGSPLFSMPKPFMTDARDNPSSPHGKAWSDQVSQTVTQHGESVRVTVRADPAWLARPERQWPVVIDPTIKIAPTPSQSQDAMILSNQPTTNFDGNGKLSVGTTSSGIARSLVKFDLSTIPPGTVIDGASLQLHYDEPETNNDHAVTVEAHRMTLGWSESTVTWNTATGGVGELGSTQVKPVDSGSAWHSFNVKAIVQSWLNGTANNGFILKAPPGTTGEGTLGLGGPIYEPSELVYNGETDVYPKLLVTFGRPSVILDPPTTVHATGAELHWSAYTDPSTSSADDLVEYQVHRSVFQNFVPSASTLIAPVAAGTLAYTDTTAVPTPADDPDPFGNAYYYMVVVKTRDGQLIPGPTELVRLPKAGRVLKIFQGNALDTTLSSLQPTTAHDTLQGGMPWFEVGNDSVVLGKARAVIKFPDLSAIPAGATVQNALMTLWSTQANNAVAAYEAHALSKDFDETTATWQRASTATAWTTQGGDFTAAAADTVDQLVTPARHNWDLTTMVKGWVATPTTNHGVLLKVANETTPAEHTLFLSNEAPEFQLRPQLRITYTEKTPDDTYYAPQPPVELDAGGQTSVDVTLTNTTATTWSAANRALSYHWALPDGTDVTNTGNQLQTPLPADLAAGGSVTVAAQVKAPVQTDTSNKRTAYTLKWDLKNTSTGQFLSQTDGIGSLDQKVAVVEPTSDQLGLERFYQYAGKNTGAGSTVMGNLASGNAVWSYDAFSNPSRGLATFVRLAYNSLDTSDSAMGFGWSLQTSSLMRLGSPLDFHPNPNPTKVTLTDGDGTSHFFTFDQASGQWKSPFGVHLFLQRLVVCDNKTEAARAWLMTRPDRTKFYFDCDGYLSAVVDNNGNELDLTWERRASNNKPIKFLQYLTDPAGRQTLTLDYYVKSQSYSYYDTTTGNKVQDSNLTNPKIIDQVESITDVSGRKLTFTYSDKGLLKELVDGAGTSLAKTFGFTYDATQGNKNVKLVKVTDPRGNNTSLAYYDPPGDDPHFHWWLKTITDRRNGPTGIAYLDPDGPQGSTLQTTVTDPLSHASTYVLDGFGRPTTATNGKNEVTQLTWDADHNVTRLEENNHAVTTWTYDPNTGYPLTMRDAQANADNTAATTFGYQTSQGGHVADLTSKTSPEGRKWSFGYDGAGNLTTVTDPAGTATTNVPNDFQTTYGYDSAGQLLSAKDANGNTTSYPAASYDPTGYPKTIIDPLGRSTGFVYDARGNVTSVTDVKGKTSTYAYDVFGRPLDSKVPKDQNANPPVFITTPAPVYDPNDNITQATAPNGAQSTYTYDPADELSEALAPKDTPTGPQRKTTYTYDLAGNLKRQVEPNGNLTTADDFFTSYGYDQIDQLTSASNANGDRISYAYDDVGNLITVIDPIKTASADPSDFTAKYTYDLAHRQQTTTDAQGNLTRTDYDHDGNVVAATDQEGNKTLIGRDTRGLVSEVKVPHSGSGTSINYNTTQYAYDQVGNQTKIITPRGVATAAADDFVEQTTYDQLNRVKERIRAFDPADPRYNTADKLTYDYDEVGNLTTVSAPPSQGQTIRNDSKLTYFDNGWVKTSTDPWDLTTTYEYNELGQQTSRTLTPAGEAPPSAGGSPAARTMSWAYFPDGKLQTRSDDGIPAGKKVVLVDNSDIQNTKTSSTTGAWPSAKSASGFYGIDYQSHAAGAGTNTFTWILNFPQAGTYEVFVRYPAVTGAATNAPFKITDSTGTVTTVPVDQTQRSGQWVSLGSFSFVTGGNSQRVALTDQANGTVVADAIKLVRNNTGEVDNEAKSFQYGYDPNGNLTSISDLSPNAAVDNYAVTYTGLNQVDTVTEKKGTTNPITKHTTSYTYDPNGNPLTRTHDNKPDTYTYDTRDLLTQVKNATSATDPSPKVTSFTYTPRGQRLHQVKANGNTVDCDDYFLDGLLRHQIERKPGGTLVSEHTLDYDPNGNRKSDTSKTMNADNHAALIQRVQTATYDPRDRIATLTKTDPTSGTTVDSEAYVYDANDNVISQTLNGTTTTFNYDRNRLQTAVTGTSTQRYNYDPWGRQDTITNAGVVLQRNVYDGFDRIVTRRTNIPGAGGEDQTNYTYDPLDRTSSRIQHVGTTSQKNTALSYLGLSDQIVDEQVSGQVQRTYQATPWGELLSQTKRNTDGTSEDAFYSFDPHTSVEALTDASGDTKATYGYTAYGQNDTQSFTGVDKPDPQDPTKEPYNFYRYTAKRFDPADGSYDLGFRDYDPGLNRFLTRDLYNGALDDLDLVTDPFTNNRYTFAAGNPTTMVDLTGHNPVMLPDGYATRSSPVSEISTVSSFRQEEQAQQDWANRHPSSPSGGSGGLPPILGWATSGARAVTSTVAGVGSAVGAFAVLVVGSLALCGDTPECAKPDVDTRENQEKDCLYGDSTKSTYQYSDRDSLGRAGTATACLVAPLERGPRTARGRNAPQVEGLIRGTHVRGHLIGSQLGGSGRRENLVPMYPRANYPWMESYEAVVREKVEAGMRVWYEVSPVYDGDARVPTSIRIRAVGRMPGSPPGALWQMAPVSIRNEEQGGILISS